MAWVAGISSARLRAIEGESSVDEPTAERIERSLAILRGMKRRLARQLIGAASDLMREVAGVR